MLSLFVILLKIIPAFAVSSPTSIYKGPGHQSIPDGIPVLSYPVEIVGQQGKQIGMTPTSTEADSGIFSSTLKAAIKAVEDGLRGTCAREIELGLTVTAEGRFQVAGFGVAGSMKTTILNPELPENCGKSKKKNR